MMSVSNVLGAAEEEREATDRPTGAAEPASRRDPFRSSQARRAAAAYAADQLASQEACAELAAAVFDGAPDARFAAGRTAAELLNGDADALP